MIVHKSPTSLSNMQIKQWDSSLRTSYPHLDLTWAYTDLLHLHIKYGYKHDNPLIPLVL